MQQMLKTKKEEEDSPTAGPSAFHLPGSFGKSPTLPSALYRSQRDSGYGTDISPASVTSASRRSTYDESDLDLTDALEDMDLNRDNDVFCEGNPTIFECSESDETDKEVEGLLNEDSGSRRPVSQPIQIKRPSAPTPEEEDKFDDGDDVDKDFYGVDKDLDLVPVSEQWIHTSCNLSREKHIKRNRFRPIVGRSVGTQTPSPQSQIIREAITTVNTLGRFQPYARGNAVTRLRLRSESEDIECKPPLPDIVPMSRDRSISLPDVPSFRRREQEQEVGRELRRISDEFNSSFTRVRRGETTHRHASSFPLVVNIDFHAYWTSLRRMLSSSPIFQPWNNDSTNDVSRFQDQNGSHR